MINIYDGHGHLGSVKEQEIRRDKRIPTFICAVNPKEARQVELVSKENPYLIPTYGLHPWHTDKYTVEDMVSFISKGNIIGEIGMDSVWCKVPLAIQQQAFLQQMDIAGQLNSPVILHTKGQEKTILELIQPYKIPILVHWYSCNDDLKGYIEKGCYFTIGPDVYENSAVQKIVKETAIDKLLVESDGFSAVQWALGQEVTLKELPEILIKSMEYIANEKSMSLLEVSKQLERNFIYLKNYKK